MCCGPGVLPVNAAFHVQDQAALCCCSTQPRGGAGSRRTNTPRGTSSRPSLNSTLPSPPPGLRVLDTLIWNSRMFYDPLNGDVMIGDCLIMNIW